jgi:hypothetical protein
MKRVQECSLASLRKEYQRLQNPECLGGIPKLVSCCMLMSKLMLHQKSLQHVAASACVHAAAAHADACHGVSTVSDIRNEQFQCHSIRWAHAWAATAARATTTRAPAIVRIYFIINCAVNISEHYEFVMRRSSVGSRNPPNASVGC